MVIWVSRLVFQKLVAIFLAHALLPFVAKMSNDLLEFVEKPREVQILDETYFSNSLPKISMKFGLDGKNENAKKLMLTSVIYLTFIQLTFLFDKIF